MNIKGFSWKFFCWAPVYENFPERPYVHRGSVRKRWYNDTGSFFGHFVVCFAKTAWLVFIRTRT